MIERSAAIALVFLVIVLVGLPSRSIAAPTPTPTPTPTCEDSTPNGGGPMRFKGIGQVTHVLTRTGEVCPGATETWTFSTIDVGSIDQYVTAEVLADHGSVSATLKLVDGTEVSLTSGTAYQTTQRYGTLQVIVMGKGGDLAAYRVRACRSIFSTPCALSDTVTAKPGDVDCNGQIDARDAFYILEYTAGLSDLPCGSVAETYLDGFINSMDAEILLQYAAGLIDQILPGY